nr:Ent-kaur-16-ene synthase [Ipomoea batatas]
MGNCLFGGVGDAENEDVVKVITSTNGVMEFYAPITVESIADEFPGHGIFRSHDLFWNPLPHHEVLLAGNSYYLLPLDKSRRSSAGAGAGETVATFEIGHVRSNSVPQIPPPLVASYRMSFDSRGILLKRSYTGAGASFSRHGFGYGYGYGSSGFWKVKLVISPKQLVEILSEETATEELIESIRTVAKCGKGGGAGVSSVAFSDQWSLSSSRNASSKKDGILSLELS